MPGPKGSGAINQDSYDGTMPNSVAPAPAKQINAADSKPGPTKPGSGGGEGKNKDSYHE